MTTTGVPETDEEAIAHFQNGEEYNPQLRKDCLIGIYKVRRAMGDNCADAQIYTLRCLVDPQHTSLTHLRKP